MKSVKRKRRIAVLTGGGDCPGLNSVLRAVTKKAIWEHDLEVVGIEDGYEGLIKEKYRKLENRDVSGILTQGGTILGTSNRANPYRYAVGPTKMVDLSKQVIRNIKKLNVACLVCIGGDGTLNTAYRLSAEGIPVIGVPKTIDNDIRETEITFGFETAVETATEAIDRIHTTGQSHHRVMVVEVMGRRAGWIALYSGTAGGGDIILIPEIPFDLGPIIQKVKERNKIGKRFSIVVVAEGAKPKGGEEVIRKIIETSPDPVRFGGIGLVVGEQIEKATGIETRTVVLGHLLRGGSPNAFDRVLTTQLGARVVEMIHRREFGFMIGLQCHRMTNVPLKKVAQGPRLIPLHHPLIEADRSIGICFGDGNGRSPSGKAL